MGSRSPQLALAAASLILVTFVVVIDLGQTSPGPLSRVHGELKQLSSDSCTQCHGSGSTSLAQACTDCHEPIGSQLELASGFHGSLPQPEDCGHCHAEHLGAEFPLVANRAFALAGFDPREQYAHEQLDFDLTGQHMDLACQECHTLADVPELAIGQQRFLGLSQDCSGCHEDPHEGRMQNACQSCHGQVFPFADLDGFIHTTNFPLQGAHAQIACTTCHGEETAYAVEALGGINPPTARDCVDCHSSPHSAPFISTIASQLEVAPGASCVHCHSLDLSLTTFEQFDAERTKALHDASGFSLLAPHDQAACADCHTGNTTTQRTAEDCASCHENPHDQQFGTGVFTSFACTDCHASEHFRPSTLGPEEHTLTGFLLEAAHATENCSDCHIQAEAPGLGAEHFAGLSQECAQCHEDAHRGRLFANGSPIEQQRNCAECHLPTSFDDFIEAQFNHGLDTSFPLEGAHLSARCEDCHPRESKPDELGRRFGRIEAIDGASITACITCHVNVHEGTMAQRSRDCDQCHDTQSFDPTRPGSFDHLTSTDFDLRGAHALADCLVCHQPRNTRDAQGRIFGLVTETFGQQVQSCADCHEDPHSEEFLRSGVAGAQTDCAQCHTENSFTADVREQFDHDAWTGFSLEGAHTQLQCIDCHSPAHAAPSATSLGGVQGSNCADCHGDPHFGQFGSEEASRCDRCHASSGSFSSVSFDHDRNSRFKLDERHELLDCAACHQAWPLEDGGEAVRYRPLGMECADCHLGEVPR